MLGMDGSRQTIISSEVERDVGAIVNKELKFTMHTQTAVAKALQTLGIIKRTIPSRSPMVMTNYIRHLSGLIWSLAYMLLASSTKVTSRN